MKLVGKKLALLTLLVVALLSMATTAYATGETVEATATVEETEATATSSDGVRAVAAGIAIAVAAGAAAVAMGLVVCKTNESIARQPEAAEQIRGSMTLGLVFIETAIIYALIVAILIIFVM